MTQRRTHRQKPCFGPDAEETKAHVLAAARELLLAAQGALKFCRCYVEETSQSKTKPYLVGFFQKATQVANELGKGILDACPTADVAKGAVKTVIESIGREMEGEARRPRTKRASGTKRARRNAR